MIHVANLRENFWATYVTRLSNSSQAFVLPFVFWEMIWTRYIISGAKIPGNFHDLDQRPLPAVLASAPFAAYLPPFGHGQVAVLLFFENLVVI